MKYFSMFSGIGGFELGIQRTENNQNREYLSKQRRSRTDSFGYGDKSSSETSEEGGNVSSSFSCIGFSEIDKYAIQTYLKHFPTHKNYGNAKEINPDELPEFDLLCGGFPCQSFSIAGKRKGFQDTRGTLFHEILRIANAKRPRILFLENVKGLLSADNGRCFATIISSLDELGYDVEWQVLNAKYFGVPQNRERVFIIGHSRKGSSRQIFPIKETNNEDKQSSEPTNKISSTRQNLQSRERYTQSSSRNSWFNSSFDEDKIIKVIDSRNYQNEEGKRIYDNISPTLMARARTDETPMIFAMRGRGEENSSTCY